MVINSEATLAALLNEGASVENNELHFEDRTWPINEGLVGHLGEVRVPPKLGGWVGYRVLVETPSALAPINTNFILKTDAKQVVSKETAIGLDSGVHIRRVIEEIDLPWKEYYGRAITILHGLNKTKLGRMRSEILVLIARDLHRMAHGIVSSYRANYALFENGYCLTNGAYQTFTRQEFVNCLLILKQQALLRHESIARELEQSGTQV